METRCANGHWITDRFTLKTDPGDVERGYIYAAIMSCAANALRDDCTYCARAYMLICERFSLDEKELPALKGEDRPANRLSRLSRMLDAHFQVPDKTISDSDTQWAFVTRNGNIP